MSGRNPSVCVVLAVTSSSAFFETGKIVNLVRAYDTLANFFDTINVAARASDIGKCRSALGDRVKAPELVPCGSMEPADFAKELSQLWADFDSVLIHDASRPFVDQEQIERVINAFEKDVDAVRPALPFTETLKILTADSVIKETLDRSSVLRISSPELIRTSAIDTGGTDCAWFLPLKTGAHVIHVEANPSGLRINSKSDGELMELQQN